MDDMSLFPSESYSFPDLTEGAPKRRNRKEPGEPDVESESIPEIPSEAVPEEATIESAIPELPVEEVQEPEVVAVEETKPVAPVNVPKPIKVIPRGRSMAAARPAVPPKPRPTHQVSPVTPVMPAVPDALEETVVDPADFESEPVETANLSGETEAISEEDIPDYEFQTWDAEDHSAARRRRRNKLIRFIFFELLAIGLFLVSTKLAIADQFAETSLTVVYKILMFTAALAAAIIPVVFYALPPTLPPGRQ